MKPWESAEIKVARLIGGKRVPGSGCGKSKKGDVVSPVFCAEVKQTSRPSLAFKVGWLEKCVADAHGRGLKPLFAVEFSDHTQTYFVLESDLSQEEAAQLKEVPVEDWTFSTSVSLRPGAPVTPFRVRSGSRIWAYVDGELVSDMAERTNEDGQVPR